MGHINLIGTSNFRTFKDHTYLELAPVNIITGNNNSGKSSLSKLLLLVKDSFNNDPLIQELNFRGHDHYLAYFENVINILSDKKYIEIELPFIFFGKTHYSIFLKYTGTHKNKSYTASCKEIKILNKSNNTYLLEASLDRSIYDTSSTYEESIQNIFTLQVNRNLLNSEIEDYSSIINQEIDSRKAVLESLFSTKQSYIPYDTVNNLEESLITESNQLALLKLDIISIKSFSSAELEEISIALSEYRTLLGNQSIKENYNITGGDIENWYGGGPKDNEITLLDYIMFFSEINEANGTYSDRNIIHRKLRLILQHLIKNGFKELELKFDESFSYLPLIRNNIERLHFMEGSVLNDTISELDEYINFDEHSNEKAFIDNWIQKFKIDDFESIQIKSFPEFNVYTLSLIEKSKIPPYNTSNTKVLADLGFGTSQLIILLSKIALEAAKNRYDDFYEESYKPHIILIEEPEAHLHPKWQALLADVIIDACTKFNTQFIVETHSEYLIRRLQYHIANGYIKNTNIKVFNVEQIHKNHSTVKDMPLDSSGGFKKQFSSDFFDEATTLKDELEGAQKIKEYEKDIIEINDKFNTKIKCIVLTEDEKAATDKEPAINHILKASGFKLEETSLQSYNGKANYQLAIGMAKSIEKLPNIECIIIHQDQDGELTKRQEFLNRQISINKLTKTHAFITKYNDIEGYFINNKHIKKLFPNLEDEKIAEIITSASDNVKDQSIKNLSKLLGDNKDIAETIYKTDIERFRHTKKMSMMINNSLSGQKNKNNSIIQYSPFVFDESLQILSKTIWQYKTD
ncbi:AAA family ATPase [Hymenobacter sp. APR13]|uniref:AAA family ATPase n=1 Tax=Hymenobacter sp. APR13 TaxID=1356852 RepID=UPI000900514E|nr:AAA family ATPase [Hymenobacter sp. APR13]